MGEEWRQTELNRRLFLAVPLSNPYHTHHSCLTPPVSHRSDERRDEPSKKPYTNKSFELLMRF